MAGQIQNVSRTSSGLGSRFWLLASARTFSVAGNGFGRVALAFGVLSLPHASASELSLVLACQAVPQLVLVLFGGVLADRFSRGRLMMSAEITAALAWGGITLAILHPASGLWLLCCLAVIAGSATALFSPAMSGVVPELVQPEQRQRANGTIRIGQNIALLAGLGASGVVTAFVGAPWALAINAVSFGVSALLIAFMRVPNPPQRKTSFVSDLRQGGQELFSRQWLWVVVAQYSVVGLALNATVGILGPLAAQDHLGGAASWGFIVAAQAVGTIGGAGLAIRVRANRPIRLAVLVTFTFALPMLLLGLGAPLWWCIGSMFVSGIANDVFGVLWSTTMQNEIPSELLSRVSAYDTFGSLAFAPLGLLIAGPVATVFGVNNSLLGCAGMILLATVAAFIAPDVRNLRANRPLASSSD
jgi:MFS family permease